MQVTKLDWDNIPDSIINLDTIPEKPFNFQKSIFPKPAVVRAGIPKLVPNTTSGLLQFSEGEGLPGSKITASLTDKNGMMWIATEKGLCKYTGEDLFIYAFIDTDPLNYNYSITRMTEDHMGRIWLTTGGDGIYIMDIDHNIILHSPLEAWGSDIICDHEGNIWASTFGSGIFFYNIQSQTVKNIKGNFASGAFNTIYAIKEDRRKNIWIGNEDDVSILDSTRKKIKKITTKQGLVSNRTISFFEDSRGNIWTGYINRGINYISLENKTVSTINNDNGFNGKGYNYAEDDQGRIWLAENDTVCVFNSQKTAFKNIVTNVKMALILKGSFITDAQGYIWLGSLDKGVLLLDSKGPLPEHIDSKNGLADNNIWGLFEDKNENIWISTYKGLNIYDPHKNQLKLLSTDQGLPDNRPSRYLESKKGEIFVGSTNGFSIINSQKKSITNFGKAQGLDKNSAPQELLLDSLNRLWLLLDKGVGRYDLTKNSLDIVNKPTGLLSEIFWDIRADRYGNFWCGTDSGVAVINPANNTIRYLRESGGLCNSNVVKIVIRDNGHIIVTTTKGISIIDPTKLTITNLTANEGLVPEILYDLLEKNGKLYAGSKDGIIVITPPDTTSIADTRKNSWSFIKYNKTQGFPFNDYNQNTAITTSNGQSWWGVTPMLTILTQFPEADTVTPNVYISRIGIMDQFPSFFSWSAMGRNLNTADTLWSESKKKYFLKSNLPADSGYLVTNKIQWDSLYSPFNLPAGLSLPYNQNYLNFSFVNNNIKGRDKIVYRYILQGADKKWSDISDRPFSRNYYSLSPGQYTFKVVTRGFNGIWSLPAAFSFTIRSPWWLTWWAYIMYAALAAFIITTYARYRSRKLQLENTALENKIKQRTAELSKSLEELKSTQTQLIQSEKMASLGELTAGIAHEIQNPLNFVNNFSDLNKELLSEMKIEMDKGNIEEAKTIANDLIENEEKINQHGKRAESIVKGMLQHSRSGSGQKEPADINSLADEYLRLSYHGLRAKDKSFNAGMKTEFDESIGKIEIIPQEIGRALLNLYNNAFYAVKEKAKQNITGYEPAVFVSTKKVNNKIEIKVTDNGNGIPENIIDKIFQPFFTTKPTGQGTGLGLSLTYDIITKGHGGELKATSEEGTGSAFIITLPFY